MPTKRKYKGKDSEMLISISTLTNAAIQHKTAIIAERALWADPFLNDLLAEINTTISTYLGVDNAAQLRAKTDLVKSSQTTGYDNLTKIKSQMKRDFRTTPARLAELYTTLGFTAHWSGAKSKDQEGTIDLMFAFKQNLTPAIQTELVAKGISATRINDVVAGAQSLLDGNINQETAKKLVPTLNEAAVIALNNIYDKAMDVATISRQLFTGQATIMDQFSYTKALEALNPGIISTLYDEIIIIQPGSLFVSAIKLTAKSRVTLTLLYDIDGVYACRNPDGCYPSASQKLQFETAIELTKAQLQGTGDYLIISNPLAENAKVQIKIQG